MRKKLLTFTALFCFALITVAQTWQSDIKVAQKIAKEKDQKIILVFQGSDWCAPCMKLDKEIWSTDIFKKYANEHYVMLKADFPRRKANRLPEEQQKKNDLLAEKYNRNGYFPHVVVLNAEGKVLGQTGYKGVSPEEYIKLLDAF
jgi:thioredoxin-related protein